ncbi:MAG: class I SAM-dependent methyltransferase [Gammaproteobacteria bacterium]
MAYDSEFVEFWNTILVPKFLRFQDILVQGLGKHSRVIFARDAVAKPGERVLDVGCGFGDTAIDLARQVGPAGCVVGIDCCRAFLDICRVDAEQAVLGNIEWVESDAETHEFDVPFDLWFSRFGTMFFSLPVAALRHLRTQLKPGGRMMMIVWHKRDLNLWAALPRDVVLRFLPEPESPDTCGPGPFSMASEEIVTQQLHAAGYTDIAFMPVDAPIMVGRNLDDAIDFQLAIGPAGEIHREAGKLAERKSDEIRTALEQALAPYLTDEGVVLPSTSWCITARNPS